MTGSDEGLRATLRLAGYFVEGNRRSLAVVIAAAILSGFAEAIVLVVIARLAFALANQHDDVTLSLGPVGNVSIAMELLLLIAVGLVLLKIALQVAGATVSSRLGARVTRKFRTRLTRSYLSASWALQSDERSGRLQEMVGAYVSAAASAVSQLANGLVALASLTAFLITAFAVNVLAAITIGVVAVGLALLLRPVRFATRRASRRAAQANLEVATAVSEVADHALEVRVFGAEGAVAGRMEQGIQQAAQLEARKAFLTSIAPVVYQGVALLLIVVVVAVLYSASVTELGAVGGVVLIMLRSLSYGQGLQTSYQALHSAAAPLEVLQGELDRYSAAALDRGGDSLDQIGDLSFEAVSFEYKPGVEVLRDISFKIGRGEIIGIVGPSGSGKSTLVQLVLRVREPSSGRLYVDGKDARTVALGDWYDRVSFVPQDAALFAGSIADNIRFYRDDVDEASIERAAKLANLHDEVVAWASAYDTPVGERGRQLSGGQRQRLCIARALAEDPDVVVFDESTSSLDVRSETLVRETMAALAPRATVFVIAHRLSTLTICDRIMVLRGGQLEGFDTPERLEQTDPFYREALELSGLR